MNDIERLLQEVAALRERVAVLESKTLPLQQFGGGHGQLVGQNLYWTHPAPHSAPPIVPDPHYTITC